MRNIDIFHKPDWQIAAEAKIRRLESNVSALTAAAEAIYQNEIFGPSMRLLKLQERRKELAAAPAPLPRVAISTNANPGAISEQIGIMLSGLDAEIEAGTAEIAEAKNRQDEAIAKSTAARALKERAVFAYQRATGITGHAGASIL